MSRRALHRIFRFTGAHGWHLGLWLALAACAAPASPRAVAAPPDPAASAEAIVRAAAPARFQLGDGAIPLGYRVELNLDPDQPDYSGFVQIAVDVRDPTSELVLNGRDLDIDSAMVLVGNEQLPASVRERKGADQAAPPDELVLELGARVAGRVNVVLSFRGHYQSDLGGLYRVNSGGHNYVFSQFEPMDARRAFPCFDEPRFKVPVEVRVRAPRGQLAVSNMPEIGRRDAERWTEFSFRSSPPLPSYLIALAVGPLEVRAWEGPETERPSVPLRVITTAGKSERGRLALDYAARELALLEAYFGSKYPYPKLDVVAVPEFASGAMENPGLVTFREELLLVTETSAAESVRRMAEVMAHELSHMWFGNWVTLSWWDDLWLNEAFATWMETGVVKNLRPDWQVEPSFLGVLGFVMSSDVTRGARAIRQPVRTQSDAVRAFSGITYTKGAAVLGMIEQWMGADAFRSAVQAYLKRHAHRSASSADLFAALGHTQLPVQDVIESFTAQAGVPEVAFRAQCDAQSKRLRLHIDQRPYQPLGGPPHAPEKRWRVPVCVRLLGQPEAECALLDGAERELELGVPQCPSSFIPNARQYGYYHSRLDGEVWAALAAAPGAALDAREQVGLMLDARAQLVAGELEIGQYLNLCQRFLTSAPRPVAAWEQLLDTTRWLREEILSSQQLPAFERWLGGVIGSELSRVGLQHKAVELDEVGLLRNELLSARALLTRDLQLMTRAKAGAQLWLRDTARISADEAAFALPAAASSNDPKLAAALLARAEEARVAEERVLALRALGESTSRELVDQILERWQQGRIKARDLRYVLPALIQRRQNRAHIRDWLAQHFDTELRPLSPFILRRIVAPALEHCDLAEREALAKWPALLAGVEGAQGLLEDSYDRGAQCAAFKARHTAGLRAFLEAR